MLMSMVPATTVTSEAATNKTLLHQAYKYKGANFAMTKKLMRAKGYKLFEPKYQNQWCTWFIANCAKNTKMSHLIPLHDKCRKMAPLAVNVGNAKVTFVNKYSYKINKKKYKGKCVYNPKYKPRKGDLILFSNFKEKGWEGKFAHIGIVRKNARSWRYVKTLEANIGEAKNYKDREVMSNIRRASDRDRYHVVVAFVTPKYKSFGVYYKTTKGKGKMKTQAITPGKKFKLRANKFKRKGYKFKGWYVKKNGKYWAVKSGKSGKSWKWSKSKKNRVLYKNKAVLKFPVKKKGKRVKQGTTLTFYAVWAKIKPKKKKTKKTTTKPSKATDPVKPAVPEDQTEPGITDPTEPTDTTAQDGTADPTDTTEQTDPTDGDQNTPSDQNDTSGQENAADGTGQGGASDGSDSENVTGPADQNSQNGQSGQSDGAGSGGQS